MENVYQQKVRHQHRELKKHRGGLENYTPSMHRAGPQKICGGNFVETIYIFIMWCLEEFTGITG